MLNLAYLVFFLVTLPFAMARNRLFGFYYAALYIYSAFAFLGYLYLPGFSESLGAYFGNDVGRTGLLFTVASMAAFWAVNMIVYRAETVRRTMIVAWHPDVVTSFGTAIFAAIALVFVGLLVANFSVLSWYIFQESALLPFQTSLFLALYKTVVGVLTTGYLILRSPDIRTNRVFVTFYVLLMAAFLVASVRLGNRTDPTALLIGIVMFEALSRKLRFRAIFGIGATILVGILALSVVEYFRYTDGGVRGPLIDRIVRNDYYAPAHMLLAVIAFDFVDPITVIRSNSANAFILLGEPYLQQTVTELFRFDIATRSAGYAFYILTEGWIFAGWGGVVYNAIIPTAGLWLWNRLACTNNRFANLLAQMLVASMLLNVTRGQSSYFIKYFYTFILPNIMLATVIVGLRFRTAGEQVEPRPAFTRRA